MRFYTGLSFKLKTKVIIKFLIALGFLILATIGIDRVNADSWTNVSTNSSTFYNGYIESLTYSSNLQDYQTDTPSISSDSNYGRSWYFNQNSKYRYNVFAFSKGHALTSSNYWHPNYLYDTASMKFSNDSYCSNNTTDLKSINFQFPLYFSTTMKNDASFFNQIAVKDYFKVRIVAESGTYLYSTFCTHSSLSGDDNGWYYLVSCNNVFQGNSNYPVDKFTIQVLNAIPFNDRYSDSTENKAIVVNWELGNGQYAFKNTYGINYQLRYSCSDDPPVLDNGEGGEDDPAGLDDIYAKIKGLLEDEETPNGMTRYLEMPDSISDLASLPLLFLQAVFENGDNICSNYEIDLSSIASNWLGHGYNSNDYKLKLPCMRNVLNTYFGGLYTLADLLLACLVFYSIGKHIFIFMDLITQGEDLFSYYYTGGDDDSHSSKANAYVNHKTGEVTYLK